MVNITLLQETLLTYLFIFGEGIVISSDYYNKTASANCQRDISGTLNLAGTYVKTQISEEKPCLHRTNWVYTTSIRRINSDRQS